MQPPHPEHENCISQAIDGDEKAVQLIIGARFVVY